MLVVCAALLACGVAIAQEPQIALPPGFVLAPGANVQVGDSGPDKPTFLDPENFGTSATNVTPGLGFASFLPIGNTVTTYTSNAVFGQRWTIAGLSALDAPLDLPEGARLNGLDLYYSDDSPTSDIVIALCRYYRSYATGGGLNNSCIAVFTSSGTPGASTTVLGVPAQYQTIQHTVDINSDGQREAIEYVIVVNFGANDGSTRITAVRPFWNRQVAPAPATATFSDVPTSHPFFRFVEALAKSGITGGCGGGLYCPDAPLTRGQMAVFLSTALGLHWPGI